MKLKERLEELLRKERDKAPTVLVRTDDGDICYVSKDGKVTKIGEIKEGNQSLFLHNSKGEMRYVNTLFIISYLILCGFQM